LAILTEPSTINKRDGIAVALLVLVKAGVTHVESRSIVERVVNTMIPESQRYRLLKLLENNPNMNQRELAQAMGVSLGKINYCLKALMEKGHVKFKNFHRNEDKRAYAYLLTPKGIQEKARVTVAFLQRKLVEYETIQVEIEELRREVEKEATI
jgi:EPS-associated MarR family transcriptional regulator